MSFLNPVVLFGLAAISVPVAIHLLNKFRVQRTRWAAMRFVQESLRRNRRQIQLEDLLLLLLRCLLVALLVFAFARPALKTLLAPAAGGSGPAATAVVLDHSASMGQSDGVETRFEQGKKAARQLLDQLEPGSRAALFLASNHSEALIAQPTTDFARFRRSLELAPLSEDASDLSQSIRSAFNALAPLAGHRREVVVYTDSQTSAWNRIEEIRQIQREHPDIQLRPVILGAKGEENLAIVGLQAKGGVPAIGQPSRFQIDVANFGAAPVEGARLTIASDGGAPADETLIPRIAPGQTQRAHLFVRFSTPGYHTVTAATSPDRLPVDNQRTAAVQVVDRTRALLVENNPQSEPFEQDGYFLANALAPVAADRLDQYYLKVGATSFARLGSVDLSANDLIFLCNPGPLSDETAARLEKYVQAGGSLVIFPGPKMDPAKWQATPALARLLPATLEPARDAGGATPLSWQTDNFEHPVTAIWNDRSEGTLSSVRFTRYFPLKLKPAAEKSPAGKPEVIVRFANGEPSVVEAAYGQGNVVLFNSTVTPQWNNLPLHPGFVSLMQRLMGYLHREQATRLALAPGETFE
ncbi:MAG TPA: BatA domain-containing protein, partial [Chthoniobacterales bacterium]